MGASVGARPAIEAGKVTDCLATGIGQYCGAAAETEKECAADFGARACGDERMRASVALIRRASSANSDSGAGDMAGLLFWLAQPAATAASLGCHQRPHLSILHGYCTAVPQHQSQSVMLARVASLTLVVFGAAAFALAGEVCC